MEDINKSELTEADICTKFITPAIKSAGWDIVHQVREQVTFTDGKIIIKGKIVKRGEKKRADYILYYKQNLPLAIIEAKDNTHAVGAGMQQGLEYGDILDIPFVFSSNGDAFIEHDKTKSVGDIEREISLDEFPTPEMLYKRFMTWKGFTPQQEEIVTQDYYYDPDKRTPRYYQEVAINKVIEAIARGQNRILLTMATGTGKTYTAFQIMWRLWKARAKKRILFLSDRNILVDDPKRRDFAPFGDVMAKLERGKFDIDKYSAYQIFLGLYQSATGTDEEQKIYKQFPQDFFDLIVIDECHRGSASDDSAWREILEYFASATQIGLTATPKETKEISNIDYFGEPVYTYSLKQGIEDGFLAPYKVIRITLDIDADGYRPTNGKIDKYGHTVEDREYNIKDYDRNLAIDERTEIVAGKITEFLKATNRFSKTIVFCIDIDHAERMRKALINKNTDLYHENPKYIMRITGDSDEGKMELDNFITPEKKYPVIVTTSKLLTTGVDAKTCELIVLDTNINSMIEFKQIIGRGTRVDPEYNKYFFTIMDFRQATKLFADPAFDGEPVKIYEKKQDEPLTDVIETEEIMETNNEYDVQKDILIENGHTMVRDGNGAEYSTDKPKKYYVNGVNVRVINETVQFYNEDGKLTTESIKDYSKKNILNKYRTLDEFLQDWSHADRKTAIIEELEEEGVFFEELEREVGKDLDPFDLILHLAYQQPALTRQERAMDVKKRDYFAKYGDQAQRVLQALLEKYEDDGIETIENLDVLKVQPFSDLGTPVEIINLFGGREGYLDAVHDMSQAIYVNNTSYGSKQRY